MRPVCSGWWSGWSEGPRLQNLGGQGVLLAHRRSGGDQGIFSISIALALIYTGAMEGITHNLYSLNAKSLTYYIRINRIVEWKKIVYLALVKLYTIMNSNYDYNMLTKVRVNI